MDTKYDWLFDDIKNLKEKIRFKDKIEYRVSGKIHNSVGPAIIYLDDEGNITDRLFYLKGRQYTEEDWNIAVRPIKLKKLKKKIKKEDEQNNS